MTDSNNINRDNKEIVESDSSISLSKLLNYLTPAIAEWKKGELEAKRLEIDFEKDIIDKEIKLRKHSYWGIFIIVLVILGISVYLFSANKDNYALDIIKLAVTIGGAMIGGYGLAKSHTKDD